MDIWGITWLVLLVLFVLIEIATLGLTTIWFAGGALIALFANMLDLPVIAQIIIFLAVSVVLLVLTRPIAIKHLNQGRIKTNAESLIGKSAVVLQDIDNLQAVGLVSVDGQEWTARCENDDMIFHKDDVVEIKAIQGVKLIVAKKGQ
ncbi:MAG: NfeD family protein [Lachnospiraceae bacterium]|nr:NfeD family protein [Lachnospiraceae bacterium]